jgi:transcriptional regulator with XRE-family HTH domain
MSSFGNFFHEKRRTTGLPLRTFCIKYNFDPGNLSKLERGLLPAPQSHEKLELYAKALQIQEGSDEWYEFFDLAILSAKRLPDDIASDEEVMKALPILFRSIRDKAIEEDHLRSLISAIRKELR